MRGNAVKKSALLAFASLLLAMTARTSRATPTAPIGATPNQPLTQLIVTDQDRQALGALRSLRTAKGMVKGDTDELLKAFKLVQQEVTDEIKLESSHYNYDDVDSYMEATQSYANFLAELRAVDFSKFNKVDLYIAVVKLEYRYEAQHTMLLNRQWLKYDDAQARAVLDPWETRLGIKDVIPQGQDQAQGEPQDEEAGPQGELQRPAWRSGRR